MRTVSRVSSIKALGRSVRNVLALSAAAALSIAAHAATILGVSPQGEVAQVRQVTVRFSEAVVAFGDPRLPDPASVACQGDVPAGAGRWVNDRAWVYDFRNALPPGTRCTLKATPEWKPLAGALTGPTEFAFATGGPAIVSTAPYQGGQIDEDQIFVLRLSGPAVESSVLANAWCEVEGIGERIGVKVVSGEVRDRLLKLRSVKDKSVIANTLLLACQRPLPNASAMRLVWGMGIAAAANPAVATRTEQRLRYTVRPAFTAEFSCERERATAPCLPIRPMWLRFSAAITRELAEAVRLVPMSGGGAASAPGVAIAPIAPVFDQDDRSPTVTQLKFPVPLPENAAFSITLPPGLKDDAERPLANAASFPLKVMTGDAPPIAKFAAAPFGVIERADPVLPVTLRHVQPDLRPASSASSASSAGAAPNGQVRVKHLQTDADILAWYAKLKQYHENQLSAKQLGWPEPQWFTTEDDSAAGIDKKTGKPILRRVERMVGTREVSLLANDASAKRLDLPQLVGGDPRPFEVVGIPLAEPGYTVVEIESLRLGQSLLDKRAPMFVRTGVLVTNLGVHFKAGRENSLVWVTTLDRGQPVAGAEIAVNDCNGTTLWSGTTDASGIARIPQPLDAGTRRCVADPGFFVTARKRDDPGGVDTAFVFSSWQKGIEPWRFNVPTGSGIASTAPTMAATSVLDRTLLRAGETVSMKHFLRVETQAGLAFPNETDLPTRLKIVHQGTGQEFVQPLQWKGTRSAISSWAIPPAAKLGLYYIVLEVAPPDESAAAAPNTTRSRWQRGPRREWQTGSFRVEEFRLPLVDARISGPKAVAIAPASLPIAVQLNYFAGGGMGQAAARASAALKRRAVAFSGYDEFSFEPPRDLSRAAGNSGDDEEPEQTEPGAKLVADKLPLTTDRNGAASFTLNELPKITRPSQIDAELSFNDPNGEVETVATSIPVWPSAVVLGVKSASWASSRGRVVFTVVALDTAGKPLKGQAASVRGRLAQTVTTRKRMVGGFYAYDNRTEQKELGVLCSGSTDDRGLLLCEAELSAAGQVELIASAKDASGNAVEAASSVWVTKQGELWFAQDNDDRIDVLPEKKRYESGETAVLQVRMPFREATALVTVEREGIIDARVVTLRGDDPTVRLNIDEAWGPNVYVAVLALRGRIRDVPWYSFFSWGWKAPLEWARAFWYEGREYQAPTAMVDLAKPAFKLGVAQIKVGVQAHELQVSVVPDKPVYSVRQKASVRVKVAFNGRPAAGVEVAFAAVDEGLLALRANDSWDLLNAMLQPRAWGVETSTAQSEIIGRRHYGRKAVAAGGGGGRGGTRELFDTLLLWRANVALDANGEAVVEVPINDSLTSFRLVAVADAVSDAGVQRFGTGSASIRVTQDLQVLSGLPPLVRDGDRFSAMLTLRNTTTHAMKVHATLAGTVRLPAGFASVSASASAPNPDYRETPLALPPQDVSLAAGAAQEITWTIDVPAEALGIAWEASAEEQGTAPAEQRARDRIKLDQRVSPAVPVRVLAATLQQLDGPVSLAVAAPADALPATGVKRGGINVALQPKLTGALPGMRRYFENYPFICLEQKVSKAVALKNPVLWAVVANSLPTYLDSDGLANYYPPRAEAGATGSDTLTAYLLAATDEAGFALPAPARDAMLDGLVAFVEGRIQRKFWSPRADIDVRKIAAIEALSRHGRAQARMLGSVNLTPNTWPTAAVIEWLRVLKHVDGIPNQAARLAEANQILRSRLSYAGTTLKFSNEDDDFWWWLMDSADANAARLILAVLDDPAWHDDLPRMVVGALGRQRGGAWLTTTANLWGSLALDKFAATFESAKITGRSTAAIGSQAGAIDWSQQPDGGAVRLPWPPQPLPLNVSQDGTGKPWLTVQSLAAIPLKEPLRAGYSVTRSLTAIEQKGKSKWSRGDVVRVRLEVDAQSDMTWVVVSDPVPGGATVLGSGLGRDSSLATVGDTNGEKREGRARPVFEERSFEAFRSYFNVLPRGKQVIEYTLRLNNPGRFALPPTRVEAMYSPETFGELPNAAVEVAP